MDNDPAASVPPVPPDVGPPPADGAGLPPPPAVQTAAPLRRLIRFLYTHNPFYVISAALVFYGLHVSFLAGSEAYQTRAMLGALMAFTLLLAVTAWLVIRLGNVWDDARTLLLLIVLLFVGISVSCDYSLTDFFRAGGVDFQQGVGNFLTGFLFAVALSEALIRSLRIRLPALLRAPYYLLLSMFFLYPMAIVPLLAEAENRWLPWALWGFSVVAGLALLTLWPATRRGAAYGRPSGTPWPYPWFPWTLFVVLASALCLRSYFLCLSFHTVPGRDTIFRPYFLAPLLLSANVLILEAVIAARRRGWQWTSLAVPLAVVALAAYGGRATLVHTSFVKEYLQTLGISPLFTTLLAAAAFYAWASTRRVRGAVDLLSLSVAAMSVVGPATIDFAGPVRLTALPLIVAALIQLPLALTRGDSRRMFAAACAALAALTIDRQGTWFTAYGGAWPLHLFVGVMLLIGSRQGDRFAKFLQATGALSLFTLGAVWEVAADRAPWLAGQPLWCVYAYQPLTVLLAWGYGRWVRNRAFYVVAAANGTGWVGVTGGRSYLALRAGLPGLKLVLWGMACFLVAATISLLKTGLPQRWLRRPAAGP